MAYTYKVLKGEKIVAEATTYAEAQKEAKRVHGHVLSPVGKRNPAHQTGSESTQVATTTGSYRKAAEMLAKQGITGKVLDYGAGLGLGADAMRGVLGQKVDAFEPEARRWQSKTPVTFTNSDHIPAHAYAGVVSLNVLNVLEPQLRAAVAKSICESVAPNGYALIGVRGVRQVMSAKTKQIASEQGAIWIPKTVAGRAVDVYQKGFTQDELIDYMRQISGPKWTWKAARGLADVGVQGHYEGAKRNPSAGNFEPESRAELLRKIASLQMGDFVTVYQKAQSTSPPQKRVDYQVVHIHDTGSVSLRHPTKRDAFGRPLHCYVTTDGDRPLVQFGNQQIAEMIGMDVMHLNPSAEEVGRLAGKGAHAVGRGLLAGAKALGRFAKSAHAGYTEARAQRKKQQSESKLGVSDQELRDFMKQKESEFKERRAQRQAMVNPRNLPKITIEDLKKNGYISQSIRYPRLEKVKNKLVETFSEQWRIWDADEQRYVTDDCATEFDAWTLAAKKINEIHEKKNWLAKRLAARTRPVPVTQGWLEKIGFRLVGGLQSGDAFKIIDPNGRYYTDHIHFSEPDAWGEAIKKYDHDYDRQRKNPRKPSKVKLIGT